MKGLFSRVTDGNRTRDNRYHNPQRKTWFRKVGRWLYPGEDAGTCSVARVTAPGADCGHDPLAALGRWTVGS